MPSSGKSVSPPHRSQHEGAEALIPALPDPRTHGEQDREARRSFRPARLGDIDQESPAVAGRVWGGIASDQPAAEAITHPLLFLARAANGSGEYRHASNQGEAAGWSDAPLPPICLMSAAVLWRTSTRVPPRP
jgi:hypothetical protein